MNKQEIFEKVCRHLATQNARSVGDSGDCAYRGENGTMCAVGCLISDECYNESLEGYTVCRSDVNEALYRSGVELDEDIYRTLEALQELHDGQNYYVNNNIVYDRLYNIAVTYQLEYHPKEWGLIV